MDDKDYEKKFWRTGLIVIVGGWIIIVVMILTMFGLQYIYSMLPK
jgi:di/tricarboxylate transporter